MPANRKSVKRFLYDPPAPVFHISLTATLVILIFVSVSLSLFFSRYPRGVSSQDPGHFRYPEFVVAFLFPQFYILYFAVTIDTFRDISSASQH